MRKLFLSISLLLSIANFAQNLITNPSFETGAIAPWSSWNPAGQASLSNNNPHTGTYSVQLNGGECSVERVISGLKPSTQYRYSAWASLASTTNNVVIGVKSFGSTFTEISFTATTYEQKSLVFTTGLTNTSATVYFYKKPGGTGIDYGDDFELIEIPTVIPTPNFGVPVVNITEGCNVTFTDKSINTPTQWQWSFPGGIPSTSTERHPTVQYLTSGSYDVSLVASNSAGSSTTFTKTAYIQVSVAGTHTATSYFLDPVNGSDTNNGTTQNTAWKTLSKVNSFTFLPGDSILFKSGATFNGYLAPKGSGDKEHPIVISNYGKGAKPQINCNGTAMAALKLSNQQYWEIAALDISNKGATALAGRTGILIEGADIGVLNHIYLKNIDVHDVNGDSYLKDGSNGGIFYNIRGSNYVSRFNDILIEGCSVQNVNRTGLSVGSSSYGALYDGYGGNYPSSIINTYSHTNVVIRSNYIINVGGDGIVPQYCNAPLIEYNMSNGACQTSAAAGVYSAGIWPWRCEDALFQYNEVSNTVLNGDGQAYDCDYSNRTIYQYNYSHDNGGGFMLMCQNESNNSIIRYNISVNDRNGLFTISQGASGKIYNNTFYISSNLNTPIFNLTGSKAINFSNNIFYNLGSSKTVGGASNYTYNNNLFYGYTSCPNGSKTADPKLTNPGTYFLADYKLLPSSPCINTGISIVDRGMFDFFKTPIYVNLPDIGAHEYSTTSSVNEVASPITDFKVYSYSSGRKIAIQANHTYLNEVDIVLYDVMGKAVYKSRLQHTDTTLKTELDLGNLVQGVYLLQLNHGMAQKLILN